MNWKQTSIGWAWGAKGVDLVTSSTLAWKDSYLKLSILDKETQSCYLVTMDGRRTTYKSLAEENWLALFFDLSPEIRKGLKGRTLWSGQGIAIVRYGEKPRTYLIVCKKTGPRAE